MLDLCSKNNLSHLSDHLFVPDFNRNLVFVSCLLEHGLIVQFNSSVLIKSDNSFILIVLLMNDFYFLTPLSYSINVIEYIDDDQLALSKKRKFSK